MPSRVRFTYARDVIDTFADLKLVTAAPSDDAAPLDHARALLASPRPSHAIIFIAHLLPRREAVWWATQCVKAMLGARADDEAFRAADAWVRTPEEDKRRAALEVANSADHRASTTWLAFAAGWSGGNLSAADQEPAQPPPAACAMAANAAVMLAAAAGDPLGVTKRIKACADAGIRFAEGGDAAVSSPTPTAPRRGGA